MLTFDEKTHTYYWNGKKVPGVTSILQAVQDFSMVPKEVLAAAQARGTAIHRMTELYDLDDLDVGELSDEMAGYLDGWIKFRQECDFVPETIETKLYHGALRYSGTSDRTGIVRRRKAVIDIKSIHNPGSPVIGLQLAAYKELHNFNGDRIEDRYALHLRADGSYRLHPYTDLSDWPVFVSLLTVKNWREKHGI